MFRLEHINYLYALGVIPVLIIIFILMNRWRKRVIHSMGDYEIVKQLMPNVSTSKMKLKFILLLIVLTLIIIGLVNPQIGSKLREVKRNGADIIIALDVSNSMKAEDLSPNRLGRAKQAIYRLLDKLEGDRIGIVVFAGEPFVQLPITTDYAAAKLFLETSDTDIIPTQGTAIGSAIRLSIESFGSDVGKNKSIIVISDGENFEDDAVKAAQEALEKGITVNTIGLGSTSGSPIPQYRNGNQIGFKKDKDGNTVVTKLNEEMLQEIAAAGNGSYIHATNSEIGLNSIMNEINKLEKKSFATKMYSDYDDKFYLFLFPALLLLIIELFINVRKSKWIMKKNRSISTIYRNAYLLFAICCSLLIGNLLYAQDDPGLIRQGNKDYEKGKFSDAEQNYAKSLQKNKDSYKGAFNLGDAYYKQGKFKEAINQFGQLPTKRVSKDTLAKAYHNLGNSYIENYRSQSKTISSDSANEDKEKMLTDGIEAYKKALKNNPNDEDTRYNLAYADQLLKQQQKKNKQNKQNKKNKDQNKDQNKEKKENKDQNNQDKKDDKKDKKQDNQQPKLSKDDAKRLLDASNNEEKNTQDKLKKEKVQGKKTQIEKDW
jgi:hypothetical protein